MHDLDRHFRAAGGGNAVRQIDDQPVAITVIGCGEEALGAHRPVEIEHDPQLPAAPRHAHLLDGTGAGLGTVHAAAQGGAVDVEDHAIRILEQLQAVGSPAG